MSDTIWTKRTPGQGSIAHVKDEPCTLLMGARWWDSDWMMIPDDTPQADGTLHPAAGHRARVTRRFYAADPLDHSSQRAVPHLWAESVGLGVAECPKGFACYETAGWPEGTWRAGEQVRGPDVDDQWCDVEEGE